MLSTEQPTVPQHSDELKVAFPAEHVLLLTMNRPKSLNAMTPTMEADIDRVLTWYENEPSLWVAIITGEGRGFCAGADLKAWNQRAQSDVTPEAEVLRTENYRPGFGAISRRQSWCKPIIAAVNGGTHGGGTELVLNCDIVIASEEAVFATPEVKRGVVAVAGVIPRLARVSGHQLASEMLLLGRPVKAHEAATRFGFVNKVVPRDQVLKEAIAWAVELTENSPDSVQSTKRALVLNSQLGDVEDVVVAHARSKEMRRVYAGDNIKAGLKAFAEKQKPVWTNPAKL